MVVVVVVVHRARSHCIEGDCLGLNSRVLTYLTVVLIDVVHNLLITNYRVLKMFFSLCESCSAPLITG